MITGSIFKNNPFLYRKRLSQKHKLIPGNCKAQNLNNYLLKITINNARLGAAGNFSYRNNYDYEHTA